MSDVTLIGPTPAAPGLPIVGQPSERGDAVRNRRRILAAARELVAAHGAGGLSMNAVAAAAGVGKGTIFRRFGDRDGLLLALLDDDTIALQDGFLSGPPPLGPGAPPGARLEAFVVAFVRFQLAHLELLLAADRSAADGGSRPLATLLIHVSALVSQLHPELDGDVLAGLILSSFSPRVIRRQQVQLGASDAQLETAAVALLRGLTG